MSRSKRGSESPTTLMHLRFCRRPMLQGSLGSSSSRVVAVGEYDLGSSKMGEARATSLGAGDERVNSNTVGDDSPNSRKADDPRHPKVNGSNGRPHSTANALLRLRSSTLLRLRSNGRGDGDASYGSDREPIDDLVRRSDWFSSRSMVSNHHRPPSSLVCNANCLFWYFVCPKNWSNSTAVWKSTGRKLCFAMGTAGRCRRKGLHSSDEEVIVTLRWP